jgi:hypothetical protein
VGTGSKAARPARSDEAATATRWPPVRRRRESRRWRALGSWLRDLSVQVVGTLLAAALTALMSLAWLLLR